MSQLLCVGGKWWEILRKIKSLLSIEVQAVNVFENVTSLRIIYLQAWNFPFFSDARRVFSLTFCLCVPRVFNCWVWNRFFTRHLWLIMLWNATLKADFVLKGNLSILKGSSLLESFFVDLEGQKKINCPHVRRKTAVSSFTSSPNPLQHSKHDKSF